MNRTFCDKCGKDITHDVNSYQDLYIFSDIFGECIHNNGAEKDYFDVNVEFDLCGDCMKYLSDEMKRFVKGFMEDKNNDNN